MVGGIATFSTILLPAGSHEFTAYYSGDSGHAADQSATVDETVNTVPWTSPTAGPVLSVGANPDSIVVGDFNRDNTADLAVANHSSNSVSILLGMGNGNFQTAVPYSTGAGPTSVVIGDFNRDGLADLAVGTSAGVSILLGNGDGTFQPAVHYPAGTGGASSLAVADFNNDGIADLAAGSLGTTTILPGNGDGTFGSAVPVNVSSALSVAALDYTLDGDVDLVATPATGSGVFVLPGNGDFTFQPPVTEPTLGNSPSASLVAAVNGNDFVDLVVGTNSTAQNLLVLNEAPYGALLLQDMLNVPVQTSALAAGDFNGDGMPDLAVVGSQGGASALEILLGGGNAGFQPATNYPVGSSQAAMALGDFVGDGRTDIALVNYNNGTVSILLGAPPSGATPVLSIVKSHSGNFLQGQSAATYSVTISNGGPATSGAVTVTENVPSGLTLTSMTGTGWTCANPGNTCTRSDSLLTWKSYQPITVQVSVASNAPEQVTNQVSVAGGGSVAASASDTVTITPPSPCDLYIDGSINITDAQLIINEALGQIPAVHDLHHQGAVRVDDIQTVINSVLGMGCILP